MTERWNTDRVREFLARQKGEAVTPENERRWSEYTWKWLSRRVELVPPVAREPGKAGRNLYEPAAVRAAFKAMPGRGGPGRPGRRARQA